MIVRPAAPRPPAMHPVEPLLDHLVYATPDLDATISQFRAATGLDPAVGGRHLGLGTRNVLVALGRTSYLEIIGPDPENPPAPDATMPFGIAGLDAPRLATWAVHPPDIEAAVTAGRSAGTDLGEIRAMQRSRPDGVVLSWRLTVQAPPVMDGVVPFLIDWGTGPHPAAGDIPRADLVSLRATHPDPEATRRALAALQVRLPVEAGPPALMAVIKAPVGAVELR